MKKIERLLIVIGVIFFANYIIHLPMCEQDYSNKDTGIYSAEYMCRHSTLTRNVKEVLRTNAIAETVEIPMKANFIFAKVKIIFEIINVQVFCWQLARGNIDASRFIGLTG